VISRGVPMMDLFRFALE